MYRSRCRSLRASKNCCAACRVRTCKSPPKTFLQILHKMLEMLGDCDYLRHGCRSPFRNGFSLPGQSQLTPSCFYTIELTPPLVALFYKCERRGLPVPESPLELYVRR